jgi:hypothetical protein
MIWETPKMVEVKMDAEIGSYQEDFRNDDERHSPFASTTTTPEKTDAES